MPPPRHFLASKIRGYVCRSCLLKLQSPVKQQSASWLSRNVTTSHHPPTTPKSKPERISQVQGLSGESTIQIFDQEDDGTLQEVQEVQEDDNGERELMMESLDDTIRELEGATGKRPDTQVDEIDDDAALTDMEQNYQDGFSIDPDVMAKQIGDKLLDRQTIEAMSTQTDFFQAQLRELGVDFSLGGQVHVKGISSARAAHLPTEEHNSTETATKASKQEADKKIEIDLTQIPQFYRQNVASLLNFLNSAWPNSLLQRGGRPNRNNIQRDLWKHYMMCRSVLVSEHKNVPLGLWKALWEVFSAGTVHSDRMARLHLLGDDMRKAHVRMELAEHILFIESCLLRTNLDQAVKEWESVDVTPPEHTPYFESYWELGTRIFSETRQIDRALFAAKKLTSSSKDPSTSRILLPIINACLKLENDPGVQLAWALYKRLRMMLSDSITMEDYDTVITMLFSADQSNLALGVFKDMMLTGDAASIQDASDSLQTGDAVMGIELSLSEVGTGSFNWQDSQALTKLPAKFNNKIFFGSWIKKLIGAGELVHAKKVLDLMQERQICPSPVHVNGLIGAWFRSGNDQHRILAEDLAWTMIRARIEFVEARNRLASSNGLVRLYGSWGKPGHKAVSSIPIATIETFTVLLQQHRRRQQYELIDELFDALKKAEIPPNTWFMNELLAMDTKGHSKRKVWNTYVSVKDLAPPNMDTFGILWQNMKKQANPVIGRKSSKQSTHFTSCRSLFSEMVKRAPSLVKTREQVLPRELYDLIILCFCYDQDQPGTAVALLALHQQFGMLPSETTARSIVLQLSRLGSVREWGMGRRFDLKSRHNRERVSSVTELLGVFKEQQDKVLLEQGINYNDLSESEQSEQTMFVLIELLRYTQQVRESEKNAAQAASLAAEEMGVPECQPWK